MTFDEVELAFEPFLHLVCDASVATFSGLVADVFQIGLLILKFVRNRLSGESVVDLLGVEGLAAVGDAGCILDRLRPLSEQLRHTFRRPQFVVRVRLSLAMRCLKRQVVAYRGQHIVQAAPCAFVETDASGSD